MIKIECLYLEIEEGNFILDYRYYCEHFPTRHKTKAKHCKNCKENTVFKSYKWVRLNIEIKRLENG